MPRHKPQVVDTNRSYSSNTEYRSLTPRTPHSRAGLAESRQSDEHEQSDEYDELELVPLVAEQHGLDDDGSAGGLSGGSREGEFKGKSKEDAAVDLTTISNAAPLVLGTAVGLFLLVLIIASFRAPDTLREYIGLANITIGLALPEPSTSPLSKLPSDNTSSSKAADLISYENYTHFPLTPSEYLAECWKAFSPTGGHGKYWSIPHDEGPLDVSHHNSNSKVCSSTVTYMLDGYVGLAADLAIMAQVAGLAREQNRTFLVNDQYWNRGSWTEHFQDVRESQPGPEPGCLPPQPEELVACPRIARHWIVNSRTARFHLSNQFAKEFEDPYARNLERLKYIFWRAQDSLQGTIRPNEENAALIRAATKEVLQDIADTGNTSPSVDRAYLGVHIRRGDRKARFWPQRDSYVSLEKFAKAISDTWTRISMLDIPKDNADAAITSPELNMAVWLASDVPQIWQNMSELVPEGTRLFSLERSDDPKLRQLASGREYVQSEFDELSLDERVEATRGAIVDLAMLSGMWAAEGDLRPMGTICTLPSNICRISAAGFGWELAFGFDNPDDDDPSRNGEINERRKRWVEIDNAGTVDPEWEAFEMF